MLIRSPYNYDRNKLSNETGLRCDDDSLAVQSQKEEADINTIVRRFGLTGKLPDNIRIPQYGDYTGVTDYQSALNQIIEAEKSFYELPATMRQQFENNPQNFLEFCTDVKNLDKMVEMGLAVKKESATGGAGVSPSTVGDSKVVAEKTQK